MITPLESTDCYHSIRDFINLGGTWYPFCTECKKVVEVESPKESRSLKELVREEVRSIIEQAGLSSPKGTDAPKPNTKNNFKEE